jgi:peptidoglycan-N-acetylglucosamine deacetylase
VLRSLVCALALALLALPATAQPAPSVDADEVTRGDPSQPNLALVFNVGAGYTPALSILDTLADKQVHATFFVMGWWAEVHPDMLRRIADDGHEVASHGGRIADLTQVSDAAVRDDLEGAEASISAVTGRTTRPLWSPPGGARNARVRGIAAELGYRTILWTVDSGDWSVDASVESVYSHLVNDASNGAIVVLHFDSATTVDTTAQILPRAVDDLRAAGYRLVTVGELLAPR